MDIRVIATETEEYELMKALRLEVLLNPIGVPASYINPEKEAADILVAAFEEDRMVGCCILTRLNETTLQLRQMAVDTASQGTGVGAAIIVFAEEEAKRSGYKLLMMHARDVVIPFYEKCGYLIAGEQFHEVGIPHHRMEKELT
ncbi:MAG: family N-acetyltransferase [Flaviaesturariibacter sp.]|nr:family N-acetyltransferase [Flaviaesturariibacter sp.]